MFRPAAELSPVSLVCMPDETLYFYPPPTKVDIFLCLNSPVLASLSKNICEGRPSNGSFTISFKYSSLRRKDHRIPRQYKSYNRALSSYSRIPEMRKS